MTHWLKLGWQDLFRHKRVTLLFIGNLAIGLIGLITIGSLENSYISYLKQSLQEILTADLMIYSSRPIEQQEQEIIDTVLGEQVTISKQVAFYSMVKGAKKSLLARIVAIDENYPLYGAFHYPDGLPFQKIRQALLVSPLATMSQETAETLYLNEGDSVRIGQTSFHVAPLFNKAPGSDVTTIELAPKIFIALSQLNKTGLLQFGSRLSYLTYYRTPKNVDAKHLAGILQKNLDQHADGGSTLRVFDTHDINSRLGSIAGHFFGYMGLVGTVALFLAGIAASYLFRGYFQSRVQEIAILMSLGAQRRYCILLFLFQLAVMGAMSAVLAILITSCMLPLLPLLFAGLLPDGLHITLHSGSMVMALALGISCSFLFCLPELTKLRTIQPLHLLHEGSVWDTPVTASSRLLWWLSLVPAILTFLLLTVFLTSSMVQGIIFTGGVAVTMLFFGIIGRLLLTWCKHLSNTFYGLPKIALRNLYRNRFPSLSIFITIATGVFLINLIPQLQRGLEQEFSHPIGLKIPIFFLVDIQEEQINGLQDFFKQQPSHLSNISPMVRGRIRSINGTSFHQRSSEADQKGRGRLRRTEFNFSSRNELDPSETVIEGKELSASTWSFQSTIPFEISVAQRFGKRYDLHLGDRMVFDIQGIELEGVVTNIRKVRWNSFQPNFFLLFQKGVLENAPKTYLASISQVSKTDKQPLKEQIVNRFPNISVIDVASTITSIIELTERLIFSIKSIALLAIGAGLMALYSIAGNEAFRHAPEINLLKVLGTRFSDIRLLTVLQFGLLGCAASVFSVFISTTLSYVISWYFFDRIWGLDIFSSIWIVIGTTLTCIFTAALATRSVIRQKPVTLLH